MGMYSIVRLTCKKCNNPIEESIYVPEPDFSAEKMKDSGVYDDGSICCSECGEEYEYSLDNSYYGLTLDVEGYDDDEISWTDPEFEHSAEEDDWYTSSTPKTHFDNFSESINEIRTLLESQHASTETTQFFKRMLFVQTITALETYLSDSLKSLILQNEDYIKILLEKDPVLKEQKFPLITIYSEPKIVHNKVAEHLNGIIYHNLPKIERLYKVVLGVSFNYGADDDKSIILKSIGYRHDCVHRNGKTAQGEELDVFTKPYIGSIIDKVEQLVGNIETKLITLRYDADF